ncbi:MAG: winged helix-turn-helix domain-containing protein [Chromatiaceae bacterium]|nr:winged helix-turn-helix domain-containing protein [Gammaproteobacteria bacterium]MCP5317719.1 winged helix-turn-helix domain-containing protein [Chromatiaceae bacterium]MCP5429265.1 winged helix-turn-helix domain-containing protein [Chromatiaceae bacterium]MCP5434809.1 winged helix-turn-helix domain-containing protein [Chromatiaceae bacterium]HOP15879.1 winged helix-turn-helix domain-containing protein [Gammaproteobacteria bacterium]
MEKTGPTSDGHPAATSFVIAGWTLEEDRHCLVRDAELRKLEPKTTKLLSHLARHAGQPLNREELLETVWPNVVVGDEALTTAINKIRRAFGDDTRHPKVIETIPKMGYRLIAPVRKTGSIVANAESPAAATQESASPIAPNHVEHAPWSVNTYGITAIGILLLFGAFMALYIRSQPDGPATFAPSPNEPALVVVSVQPFEVLGDDPEQQYLARGVTADLVAQLSRLSGMHVIAAATPQSADGEAGQQVGKKIYSVWGGVRLEGQSLEVEVHLTESATGRQLWSHRYARPFDDLFEIQREIGTQFAQALSLRLSKTELERIAHRYTRSVAAYDLFLRAQSELLVRSASNNERARDLYMQAVSLDPAFARAYGGLALIYAGNYRNQWADDRNRALEQALKFANSAKEIDPTLPEIHWVLGYVKTQQRRHGEALAHLDDALRLDPRFADALALKGGIKTYTGKPEETVVLLRHAMRLNPAAGYLYFMTLGRAYFFLGDNEQAVINLREALSRNPTSLEVHAYLAAALQLSGDQEEAEWQAEEIRSIKPDFTVSGMMETYPLVDGNLLAKLSSSLGELGL